MTHERRHRVISDLDKTALAEHADPYPDHRAELDHRVRPDQTLGFRQL